MTTYKTLCSIAILFAITACNPMPKSEIDGRSLLEKIAGPKVDSVERTMLNSAKNATERGDYNRALQLYKQLLDKYPEKIEYMLATADILRRIGQADEAIRYFDKVLEEDENNIVALEGKGLSVMAKGDETEASKLFSRVMKRDSKRWRTLNAIGILFTLKHMVDEAMAYYEEALDYSKNNVSVLNNIGLSLLINKEYDKAIDILKKAQLKAVADSPQKKQVELNLALAYGLAGQLDEAEEVASRHLSEAALYNNMGLYAQLAENPEVARSYLNMALMNSPVYYERAWNNLEALGGEKKNKKRNKKKNNKKKKIEKSEN